MELEIDEKGLRSLLILGSVVEARDAYTGGHLWRVSQFSRLLGEKAGLSESEVFVAAVGGFLHDFGKVGIPDAILMKPGKLTQSEYERIKTHPSIGRNVIREHSLAVLAVDSVAHHHERPDGTGYPDGLFKDEIPLFARIVSISDAFDAMTSTRPYRKGMPIEQALSILEREREKQFDGKLMDLFMSLAPSGPLRHIVGHSGRGQPMVHCLNCGPVIAVSKSARSGDHVFCKACGGEFQLHGNGDSFETEFQGNMGTPDQLKPEAELDPVDELIQQRPKKVVL